MPRVAAVGYAGAFLAMKPLQTSLALLGLLTIPSLGLSPQLAAKDLDPEDLYEKVVKSCVYICAPVKGGMAQGSGSLIDVDKKIVLTNYHVVDEGDLVFIQFPVYIKGVMLTDKE